MAYYNTGFTSSALGDGRLGGILRGIGSVVSTAGGIAAAVLPALYHTRATAPPQAAAAGPTAHPVISAAAPTTAVGRAEEAIMHPIATTEQLMGFGGHAAAHGRYAAAGTKGYHMIKKGPHAGLWTRNRHRNPCNIHALRRAISRAHSFEKIARKVIHFTHPRKATGTAHFKTRRRRT